MHSNTTIAGLAQDRLFPLRLAVLFPSGKSSAMVGGGAFSGCAGGAGCGFDSQDSQYPTGMKQAHRTSAASAAGVVANPASPVSRRHPPGSAAGPFTPPTPNATSTSPSLGGVESQAVGAMVACDVAASGVGFGTRTAPPLQHSSVLTTIANGLKMFRCAKCWKDKDVKECQTKGSQLWCQDDVSAYNQLTIRWKANPKLRTWWQKMKPQEQCDWFLKWQGMRTKVRFDVISYIEKTIHAKEMVIDVLDNYVPLSRYIRERWLEDRSLSNAAITREFTDIVESRQYECIQERGEWLIPRFDGVQKLHRTRLSQEMQMMRSVDINNAQDVTSLWEGQSERDPPLNTPLFYVGVSF